MIPTVEYRLPFPPSVNHLWKTMVRHGKPVTYIGKEGTQYRHLVRFAVLEQSKGKCPLDGRLTLIIVAHAKDNARRDLDNLVKAVQDSMQHAGVYKDDSQIDSLHISRGETDPEKKGYLLVSIMRREGDLFT